MSSLSAYYITTIEVLSGFNLMLSVMVLRIYSHEAEDPMPRYMEKLITDDKVQNSRRNPWHLAAKKCDSVLFLGSLIIVIFITVILMICLLL